MQDNISPHPEASSTGQHALENIGTRLATSSALGGPITTEPHHASNPLPRPSFNQSQMGRFTSVSAIAPSVERLDDMEISPGFGHHDLGRDNGMRPSQTFSILPPQIHSADPSRPRRPRTFDGYSANQGIGRRLGSDWVAPATETDMRRLTVSERLGPTIADAKKACLKYKARARMTGLILNIAIGIQVLLGSITTGFSAAATSGTRSTAIQTTVFGIMSTMVASYLARTRGTNEPESSIARVKDLEHFLREVRAFDLDHGGDVDEWSTEINYFRKKLQEMLGSRKK